MSTPVTIDVPEVQTFDFKLQGGKKIYHFPLPKFLPRSLAKKMTHVAEVTDTVQQNIAGQEFIDALFEKYAPDLVDDEALTPDLQMTIFIQWKGFTIEGDGEKVDLGE